MKAAVVKNTGLFSDRESVLELAKEFGVRTVVQCHYSDEVRDMSTQVIKGHLIEKIISDLESDNEEIIQPVLENIGKYVESLGLNEVSADKLYRLNSALYVHAQNLVSSDEKCKTKNSILQAKESIESFCKNMARRHVSPQPNPLLA